MSDDHTNTASGGSAGPRIWVGLCIFLGVAVFLLWEEHRAHLLGALPYLLLLACPFVHLFLHRGHHQAKQFEKEP